MTTPAEEIRIAAETLCGRAAKATPGPWKYDERFGRVKTVAYDTGDDDGLWIAMMSPDIAEHLAALMVDAEDSYGEVHPDALKIARLINAQTR